MNTHEIVKALHFHPCTSRYFVGVFPSDQLPVTVPTRPAILIANTDTSKQPGRHWVAFFLTEKNSHGYYFDSYGLSPLKPSFITFLNRNCSTWSHNHHHLQSVWSIVCGQYCCVFLAFMCEKYHVTRDPIHAFVNLFISTTDHKQNDDWVVKKFQCWFRKYCKRPCNDISKYCCDKLVQTCCSQY